MLYYSEGWNGVHSKPAQNLAARLYVAILSYGPAILMKGPGRGLPGLRVHACPGMHGGQGSRTLRLTWAAVVVVVGALSDANWGSLNLLRCHPGRLVCADVLL